MSQNSKTEFEASRANPPDKDTVITPAGPVSKDRVRPVGPDEEVRRKQDGSLEVVPKDASGSDHP